jgi:hypothetical protein
MEAALVSSCCQFSLPLCLAIEATRIAVGSARSVARNTRRLRTLQFSAQIGALPAYTLRESDQRGNLLLEFNDAVTQLS